MATGGATPGERVLIVEGEDDKHVVLQLCIRLNFEPEFCIVSKGGIENVLKGISLDVKAPDRKAVGIVVDANDDPSARWAKVTERLRSAGIEPPNGPKPGGTVIDSIPRVGIWLMPDNESAGELEDFVQTMIPPDDQVWPLSESYINNIPTEFQRFRPGKVLRAQMYAWLATRRLPGRMGAAIEAEDLDINVEGCTNFVAWLQKLFN